MKQGPEDFDWYRGPWFGGHGFANFEDKPLANPNKVPAGFWPEGGKKPVMARKARKTKKRV